MTDDATRRAFVASLAALGLLPAVAEQANGHVDADRVDVTCSEHGTTRADVAPGSPVFGSVEIGVFDDRETRISVAGYGYDDEESDIIEMRAVLGGASVTLSCSPERARELAAELRTAADHADGNGGTN